MSKFLCALGNIDEAICREEFVPADVYIKRYIGDTILQMEIGLSLCNDALANVNAIASGVASQRTAMPRILRHLGT